MPQAPDSIKKSRNAQKSLGTHWYSDQALSHFIEDMKQTYPDSLIIVTGDHSHLPAELNKTSLLQRSEYTFREQFCTSFMMYHRDIDQDILTGNTIGGHMNIMPTILELIAPKGFAYYSLFPSLLEPIDQVITPYHWLTPKAIGACTNQFYQPLSLGANDIETLTSNTSLKQEADAWCSLTSWFVRHPDKLEQISLFHNPRHL